MAAVVQTIANGARWSLQDENAQTLARQVLQEQAALVALEGFLTRWCEASPLPVVLLLDEVDALVGDTLISLLRQLRAGYPKRPTQFPQTVILCGVRDLRDYRIHASSEKTAITGGSAFNIKAKSLRLGDFNAAEVTALLQQHTAETGQIFTPEALDAVWTLTLGQPWLINALAYEVVFPDARRSRPQPADYRGKIRAGQGKFDPAAGHPSGPIGRQAARGASAAGHRADAGRRSARRSSQ